MNPPGTMKVAISPSTIKTIASMRTGAIAGLVPARGTRKRRTRRGVYPRRVRRGWVRIGGPALFVAGSVVMVAVAGIPTAKDRLLVWLLLGLIAFSLVDARRLLPRLVLEWSPFIGFLLAYDLLRGETDIRWWDYVAWLVYLTHFFATFVLAAVLWRWAHDRFARYATMVAALAALGFTTYVL